MSEKRLSRFIKKHAMTWFILAVVFFIGWLYGWKNTREAVEAGHELCWSLQSDYNDFDVDGCVDDYNEMAEIGGEPDDIY